jgi:PIN domain nuclease of toxin-antitoxin system
MSVLDAYAVIAFLRNEAPADRVRGLLEDGAATISAVNVAEVVDVLVRAYRHPTMDVGEKLDWLAAAGLVTLPVDDDVARRAGALRAGHYHRRRSPISLADSVALATAISRADPLATSDAPLLEVARAEGCTVIAL